jgi:hypothetical protein
MLCVEKGILMYRKKNEIIITYVDGMWHWLKNEYKSDLGVFAQSKCNVIHFSFVGHYMFRPKWPSSGVRVIMVKDSAAHCDAVFFPPIVVASGYFGYVGCTWLLLVLFGLLVVAALSVSCGGGNSLVC